MVGAARTSFLLGVLCVLLHCGCGVEGSSLKQLYLYSILPPGESTPVIDYQLPNTTGLNEEAEKAVNEAALKPDFLYSPNNGPRIVEFYAPWCPHCQHFRPKFVQFARRLEKLTEPYGVHVPVYAVSCTAFKKLCHNQNVHGYPTLKIFKAGDTNGTISKYYDLHPFEVLPTIGIQVDDVDEKAVNQAEKAGGGGAAAAAAAAQKPTSNRLGGSSSSANKAKDKSDTKRVTLSRMDKRTKKDLYNDAYLSLQFSFTNGIFMENGPLSNQTANAFYDWLYLLQKTLPPTWKVQSMLREIIDDFEKVVQDEVHLQSIVEKYPPPVSTWSESCTHGTAGMGYTCGLWELFHIMTVGLVEWNEHVVTDDGWAHLRTATSAEILRNFIANFFSCEVCRANFLHDYDNCAYERCNRLTEYAGSLNDWIEFPMWLFETHNGVNVRLMKERAQREHVTTTLQDEQDVQWPPRIDCPKCWKEDGTWDEESVYQHLRVEYWMEDDKSESLKMRLLEPIPVMDGDANDDEWSVPSFTYWLPVVIVVSMFAWVFKDEYIRHKTGRHKKTDS